MFGRRRREPTTDPTMAVIADATRRIAQRRLAESYADGLGHGVEQSMLALLGKLEGEAAVGNYGGPLSDEVREWAEGVLARSRSVDRVALVRQAAVRTT
jgi:hypothetical protein